MQENYTSAEKIMIVGLVADEMRRIETMKAEGVANINEHRIDILEAQKKKTFANLQASRSDK